MNRKPLPYAARVFRATALILLAPLATGEAQTSPGPYEILPFEDGFIVEAFFDLETSAGPRADWTGWSGTTWVSPNAYDNHKGTDIALQTGTPLYALAAGTVAEVQTSYAENDHSMGGHGNYIKIALDDPAPNGETLFVIYAHMLSVSATVGQRVEAGDQVGLSDNTGNSTSEHVHIQSEIPGGEARCPHYWAHYKYPILFNPTGTSQLGHVVKVIAASAPIRSDRFDTSPTVSTAHQGQRFFASFAKRGYYRIFIPSHSGLRSAWIRATEVEEIFNGTVIQPLPDDVVYTHAGQLQSTYPVRASPSDGAEQIGQILFGGGRFVADQTTDGYHRIPLPGAVPAWGWVKADHRMVVYPELFNPAIDPTASPFRTFPIVESFTEPGRSMFGRAKFTRSVVKAFGPASPGGDGHALFMTDALNSGNGLTESVLVGIPGHRNYFVQCEVYLHYRPSYVNPSLNRWERYGIFLRDDGFAGMSHSFEGAGNGYALVFDSDDGRLRAGRLVEGSASDFLPTPRYLTSSGWHTLRIEARETTLRYFLGDELLIEVTDTTFPAGPCGIGYYWNPNGSYPAGRGAHFDNFVADTLDPVALRLSTLRLQPSGTVRFLIHNDVGSTTRIEHTDTLAGPGNWQILAEVLNATSVVEFEDDPAGAQSRFYRATRLP